MIVWQRCRPAGLSQHAPITMVMFITHAQSGIVVVT